ncbi:ATP-binding cassette domain-containing protein, partial [bacterium]|nr:ATP-binding cassette domain-containing protein [bacterium]
GLRKSYGDVHAVREVNLSIPRGSIYGFLGPNGAGKTTTIRSIMNILVPDGGQILFDGQPLTRQRLDRIGYLPEERGLYRKMTCLDQLVFLGQLKSLDRGDARERGRRWLERVDLAAWADRKVDALSKGMQQKVQLAATFLFDPDLVILDEPFSGLDPLNVEIMRDIIREQNDRGCTIIFSTHMLAQAERLCDHICLIEGGEVVVDGTIDRVRDRFPQDSVRAAYPDGVAMPQTLPGVTRIERDENAWRLTLAEGADPQQVLDALRAHGPVTLFAAHRPSLDEIFLTAVRQRRGAAKEAVR